VQEASLKLPRSLAQERRQNFRLFPSGKGRSGEILLL